MSEELRYRLVDGERPLERGQPSQPAPPDRLNGGVTVRAGAVLLDMDGTLVDSSAVVNRIWIDWADHHGLAVSDVLAVVHGRRGEASMEILLPQRSREENVADERRMHELEIGDLDGVTEIAGAAQLLSSLSGLPHALVTSAPEGLARARLEAAGLPMPPVVVTAEAVVNSKPDPEGFLSAAGALGVQPADCVVFEDSAAGIEAGRNAGMRVVGVGLDALKHGADWMVADLAGVRIEATEDSSVKVHLSLPEE